MQFDYLVVSQATASINVEDVGNCSLRSFNDIGQEYILIIETRLGFSRIFMYGPSLVDLAILPNSCGCSYQKIEYNLKRLIKIIDDFVNSHAATQIEVVEKEEALNDCRSIIEYMRQDILF